jgi:hypothetical protein
MSIIRQSTVAQNEIRTARVTEAATDGLRLEHLRAFIAEANKANLPDHAAVKITERAIPSQPGSTTTPSPQPRSLEIESSVTEPVFAEFGEEAA